MQYARWRSSCHVEKFLRPLCSKSEETNVLVFNENLCFTVYRLYFLKKIFKDLLFK